MFGKLRLTGRIGIGFGLLVAGVAALGWLAARDLDGLSLRLDEITAHRAFVDGLTELERDCETYLDTAETWSLTRDADRFGQAADARERLRQRLADMSPARHARPAHGDDEMRRLDFRLDEHWRDLTRARESRDAITKLRRELGAHCGDFIVACAECADLAAADAGGSVAASGTTPAAQLTAALATGRELREAWLRSEGRSDQLDLLAVGERFGLAGCDLDGIKRIAGGTPAFGLMRQSARNCRYTLDLLRGAVDRLRGSDGEQAAAATLIRKEVRDLQRNGVRREASLVAGFDAAFHATAMHSLAALGLLIGGGLLLALASLRFGATPLRRLNAAVVDGAGAVTEAAGLLSEAGLGLRDGGEEQAASAARALDAAESLAGAGDAADTRRILEQLTEAAERAGRGDEGMRRLAEALHGARDAVREAETLAGAVDEIALLAKLLAMNADGTPLALRNRDRNAAPAAGDRTLIEGARKLERRAAETARRIGNLTGAALAGVERGQLEACAAGELIAAAADDAEQARASLERLAAREARRAGELGSLAAELRLLDAAERHQAIGAAETAALAGELERKFVELRKAASEMTDYVDRPRRRREAQGGRRPAVARPAVAVVVARPAAAHSGAAAVARPAVARAAAAQGEPDAALRKRVTATKAMSAGSGR